MIVIGGKKKGIFREERVNHSREINPSSFAHSSKKNQSSNWQKKSGATITIVANRDGGNVPLGGGKEFQKCEAALSG